MKRKMMKITGLVCGLGLLLGTGFGTLTASATTVSDVIAHAYAVGMPEAQIQQYINQFSGGEYTSEQCDKAIGALDEWAAERDAAIEKELAKGTTTAAPQSSGKTTTTEAAGTAAAAQTTQKPTKQEFIDMPLDQKVDYVNSLPSQERTEFINQMSNEERNSFLKQMDASSQAAVISELLGVGDAFGLSFSVDTLSDGAVAISARDADGNLVDVSTFGDTVEQTGIPYTVPVLAGGGAILLAAGGIAILFAHAAQKKKQGS